jgi:stearoyl-CoA desaturase (delta-9 desaturase)
MDRSEGAAMTLELTSSPPLERTSSAASVLNPFEAEERLPDLTGRVVTGLIVGVPFLALAAGIVGFWGHAIGLRDLLLAVSLYFLTGHGMSIGFHRLAAHKSFTARRSLKLVLLAFGSMSFEGGPISWVANHRRHHVFADTADDPHSPQHHGSGAGGRWKGLWHAHVGWLFTARSTSRRRHAADLLADRDIVVMDALFPFWCVVSLAVPFGLGWLLGGTLEAALSALFWAGLVRVCVLHHATWSVNSVCHMFGRRPFATKDRSSNVAWLAVLSMGESWHNGHHAFPRSVRHGLLRRQWDSSAVLIRAFERMTLARDLHAPAADAIRNRSVANGEDHGRAPSQRVTDLA